MPLLKGCQQGWGDDGRIVLRAVEGETDGCEDGARTGGGGVSSYLSQQRQGHIGRILPAGCGK